MRLILFHKILIAAAATLGVILAVWGFHDLAVEHKPASAGVGIFGVVIAIALALYFRTIDRRYAKLAPPKR
jgi:hypothetical protein